MVWVQYGFDECLRRLDEDEKDIFQLQSNGPNVPLGPMSRNRYKYVVTRDVRFEYMSSAGPVRGVIPKGFMCDGFSMGIPLF
jgi:hypothetical protein